MNSKVESAILQSLATSFEMVDKGFPLQVSFHPKDIAKVLNHAAEKASSTTRLVVRSPQD